MFLIYVFCQIKRKYVAKIDTIYVFYMFKSCVFGEFTFIPTITVKKW